MPGKLLVVDDAVIIREIIKDVARGIGWTIVGEGRNGREAIERYSATRPDVVTLDLVMPEFDGLHAVRGIREIDPAARIVVVSALDQKDTLKSAFKLGASDYLVKPFDRKVLAETLEMLLATAAVTA
jgi:two-component system, chemotaxis family, chemotaxis protein CheY